MGRAYAGVLGYLAAALTLARGFMASGGVESTMMNAIVALVIFAMIGFVLGSVAQETVDQSVRQRLEENLEASQSTEAT
ncbi:hypothetical protein [Aeoliella mucimassa]|uniref:Uncharacterized protein n=1 Tax=Aeoliella mucimassa TaxID=2527972 RepID=A0A518AKX5_9BACT|nr:hypothetical protein [Aeoliella mucimassa]QDU55334.1 hypothetical protein Pan181_15230 [Aeoliella mucimassa]